MKNYYELLEIDQNASKEIIEKAYKVLVKKYHPDLQNSPEGKEKCEEKIKQINEAYNTISNPELRAEYDIKLDEENKMKINKQVEARRKAQQQEQEMYYKKQEMQQKPNVSKQNNMDEEYEAKIQQVMRQREQEKKYNDAINKAYHDAYIRDLKNRGYKIRYKKTLNDYVRSLIALLITIGIIFLILQLPFVKDYINNLYQNNDIIRGIIDVISNLFK